MAVPSSGPLQLRGDINLEVNGNVTDTNVALHQLSIDAGFSSPDAMSDFYGYSSVVPPSVTSSPSSFSNSVMTTNGNVTDTGGEDVSDTRVNHKLLTEYILRNRFVIDHELIPKRLNNE